jgi:cytochrome c553
MNRLEPGDRRLRRGAVIVVATILALGALLGFIILPIVQGSRIGLSPGMAMQRSLGVQPGTPAAPQPPSVGEALPVSQVAWTPEVIRSLALADREAAAAAAEACTGCHGSGGVSPSPIFPHLAGQSAFAIYKQLHDYRSGSRVNDIMSPFAQGLDAETIVLVAAHFSALDRGTLDPVPDVDDPAIADLVTQGDPARAIPACVSCHGTGAGGPIETPTIAGQHAEYLADQLRRYASGERQNDVYGRMRQIAGQLTEEEISGLAAYYAAVFD